MENELREPAVAYGKSKFTIEEYLKMEEISEEKHEHYQGEIFVMPGLKVPHNIIAGNVYGELKQMLKENLAVRLIVTNGFIFLKISCLPMPIFP